MIKIVIGPFIDRNALSREAIPIVQISIEECGDRRALMVSHIVFSHLPRIIGKTVRERSRRRELQQPHVFIGVAGEQHYIRWLEECFASLDIVDPGYTATIICNNPRNAGEGHHLEITRVHGLWNHSERGGALCLHMAATLVTETVILARWATIEKFCCDCRWTLKWIPSQIFSSVTH